MAIIYEQKYHKIAKSINDFVNNTTEIQMDVYASQADRDKEKQTQAVVDLFKSKVNAVLVLNIQELISATNQIVPIESITDKESFLDQHPSIKVMADRQEAMENEGLRIIDSIQKVQINIEELKFKNDWINLGLNTELCSPVGYLGTESIGLDNIRTNELTALYAAVKEKIVSPVMDC